MKVINNRYKLIDILENDGHGTTYIAIDLLKSNEKKFLKIFNRNFLDSEFINDLIENFI